MRLRVMLGVMLLVGLAAAAGRRPLILYRGGDYGKVVFDHQLHASEGFRCVVCHTDFAGTGKILFTTKKQGLITFADHTRGTKCFACHNGDGVPAAQRGASYDGRAALNTCDHCHRKTGDCATCHPTAGTSFTAGVVHWSPRSEPPPMQWVRTLYLAVILLVVGLMALHNVGDWARKPFRTRMWAGLKSASSAAGVRMFGFERLEHGLLALSFTLLVWSGFAMKYPNQWWATGLLAWESGWAIRGTVHRIAGVVLVALAVTHVVSVLASRKLWDHWKSLVPRLSDFREARAALAYNLGLRRQKPAVSAHSYIEKVEYWAVVWGVALMAATGFLLWTHNGMLSKLPAILVNVAGSIHFYEAVLAGLAIVVWHLYRVIFDPDVYPMDLSWLTGHSAREHLVEDPGKRCADPTQIGLRAPTWWRKFTHI